MKIKQVTDTLNKNSNSIDQDSMDEYETSKDKR